MNETKRPLKVFLCHAHSDKDAVKTLYSRLTNDGVDAWLDKEKLLPGQDWELEIRKSVREADVVVVCLSKQFNQAGFRQKEVRWALDTAMEQIEGEIFIVPARLEDCGTLENLRKWHWVDLFDPDGYGQLRRALQIRAEKVGAVFGVQTVELSVKDQAGQVEQLSVLQEIGSLIHSINSPDNLQIILQKMLENIALHVKADAADILLFDASKNKLNLIMKVGFPASQENLLEFDRTKMGLSVTEPHKIQISNLTTLADEFFQREQFVSYLSVPLIAKGKLVGFVEIFHRPPAVLDDARVTFVEILADQIALALDSAISFEDRERAKLELAVTYEATIEGWVRALDLREKDLSGHTYRVVNLTLLLARTMGISEDALLDIRRGALLHDIGKMGIPDEILLKEENLTDDEWKILQKHPQYAYEMLSPIPYLHPALDIPYCHHERWDGMGYPRGLKGDEIPFVARMFAVVDVYDTLASDRPYRRGWLRDKILDYIQEQSGRQFDPQIVDAFLKLIKS